MSSKDKLLKSIENNPKDVKFNDIKKFLEWFGFELISVTGSHHKFKCGDKSVVVPYHKPIKEVYIKQILDLIKDKK